MSSSRSSLATHLFQDLLISWLKPPLKGKDVALKHQRLYQGHFKWKVKNCSVKSTKIEYIHKISPRITAESELITCYCSKSLETEIIKLFDEEFI